ncbi:MAG: helix-turn-helix domain-containing protein [Lachnospiraceae bacterium]|nr:helix-turn-helix domain-containing protein [Lachnospiraceae bacterium]
MAAKESFALRLYAIRENKGLSRQKVADDLGISRASLEYYEKGKRTPDINTIELIADYFGISIDYLLGVTDCQSYDTDIRQICDYTGLSKGAVEALHECKEMAKSSEYRAILNDFIEQRRMYTLISEFANYRALTNDIENLKKECSDLMKKENVTVFKMSKTTFDSDEYKSLSHETSNLNKEISNLQDKIHNMNKELKLSLLSIQELVTNYVDPRRYAEN